MSLQDSRQISQVKILLKTGVDGAGILSIEKTGSTGLVDTYTITLDDGRKTTFEVTNGEDGNGIANIAKTSSAGLVDTYTITMDDGYTYTFDVTNGRDGGMSTMFLISSDAGSTVTVTTPSGTVIPATQAAGSTTQWEAETVEYGVHTITSSLGGVDVTTTVNVTETRIYNVTLTHFSATITVTYNPSDAICTCVGGSESYTATGSPYTFTIHSAATYTITLTNGVATQTSSVVISTSGQSENVSISLIPDGSTVTPTDDIQTWLNCADIWDKAYTTISQVLADSTTLSTLIADSNAVDYMVRSTTWASAVCADQTAMSYIGIDDNCADTLLSDSTWLNAICNSTYFESVLNTKIPTMTGYTTPSGQASASSEYNWDTTHMYAWRAFDGNDATSWVGGTANYFRLVYKFTEAVKIMKMYMTTNTQTARKFTNLKIQGSNDGSTWTDIFTAQSYDSTSSPYTNNFVNNTAYEYYALYVDKNGATLDSSPAVFTLQLYGRA